MGEDGRHIVSAHQTTERRGGLVLVGSLSHHHGVGKIRQRFLSQVHSDAGLCLIRAAKHAVDPGNVFGIGNGACGRVEEPQAALPLPPAYTMGRGSRVERPSAVAPRNDDRLL